MEVTDATFEREVVARSAEVPVVVDLWAEWCGPCRTLGPILERVVAATDGRVALAKIDVDANPRAAASFAVQSIPAVFALRDGQVVDSFVGALPEPAVTAFVDRLAPPATEADRLVAAGDEASLRRALELEPGHVAGALALAGIVAARGEADEALALLARLPETAEVRRAVAHVRVGAQPGAESPGADVESRLDELLDRVRSDDEARQAFVDLLEVLGPDDPRTAGYRRALASRLY